MNCNCNSVNSNRPYMTDFKGNGYEDQAIAMAYVPWQQFRNLYDLDRALQAGTIFAELDKPFTGKGGICHEHRM